MTSSNERIEIREPKREYLEETLAALAGASAVVLADGAVGADGAELVGVEVLVVGEAEGLSGGSGRGCLRVSDRRVGECPATSRRVCVSTTVVMMLIERSMSVAYAIKRRAEGLSERSALHDASWEAGEEDRQLEGVSRSTRHQKSAGRRPNVHTSRISARLINTSPNIAHRWRQKLHLLVSLP